MVLQQTAVLLRFSTGAPLPLNCPTGCSQRWT